MAITGFLHKGLEELFFKGRTRRIGSEYLNRLKMLLDALDAATCVQDLAGAKGFHALKGDRTGTFALQVSGNWRLTFRFENGTAGAVLNVNFEDYH